MAQNTTLGCTTIQLAVATTYNVVGGWNIKGRTLTIDGQGLAAWITVSGNNSLASVSADGALTFLNVTLRRPATTASSPLLWVTSNGTITLTTVLIDHVTLATTNALGACLALEGDKISASLTDVTFSSCTATGKGGAIGITRADTFGTNLALNNVNFLHASAVEGGGVYVAANKGLVTIPTSGTLNFTKSAAFISGASFFVFNSPNVTVTGSTTTWIFQECYAPDGGAIKLQGVTQNAQGIEFTAGDVILTATGTSDAYGDTTGIAFSLHWNGAPMTVTIASLMVDGYILTGTSSRSSIIYADWAPIQTYSHGTSYMRVLGNVAVWNSHATAFYLTDQNVRAHDADTLLIDVLGNVSVANNKANLAGAIVADCANGNITLRANKFGFVNNTAWSGGAIYVSGTQGLFTLSSNVFVVFNGNNATNMGGAIYTLLGSNIVIDTPTIEIESNSAKYGGALAMSSPPGVAFSSRLTSLTFTSNYATAAGGALFLNGPFTALPAMLYSPLPIFIGNGAPSGCIVDFADNLAPPPGCANNATTPFKASFTNNFVVGNAPPAYCAIADALCTGFTPYVPPPTNKPSLGFIIGISVAGGLLLLGIVVAVSYYLIRNCKQTGSEREKYSLLNQDDRRR